MHLHTGVYFVLKTVLDYSLLRLFIGLITAAFMAWKLTVKRAIPMMMPPDSANIHHSTGVR